jgi:ketosteroid isomerase-like protein
MSDMKIDAIDQWHQMMATGRYDGLQELLADDCVFWSPVVHTPQRGRDLTLMYLTAAGQVFDTDFRYVREVKSGDTAVLEFECSVDDIHVNGIDMIRVENNQIIDFKVMIRPLKAVNKIHEKMMAMLAQVTAAS